MKWGENETHHFVKIYTKYENLWNPRNIIYKVRSERLKSYGKIISQFQANTGILLTVSELTSKIRILRSTYILELEKIAKRSRGGYSYKTKIKWFADMHKCLKNVAKTKKSDPTIIESDAIEEEKIWVPENKEVEAITNERKLWVSDREHTETDMASDNFLSETNDDYFLILKSETQDSSFKAKQQEKCRSYSPNHSDGTFRDSLTDSNSDLAKDDEFEIYGKYIASQLRRMGLQKALRLQLEIQSLVSNARISEILSHK